MESSDLKDLVPGKTKVVDDLGLRHFSGRTQGSSRSVLSTPKKDSENVRPYSEGDPIHLIDWQVYAKTDQLMVRRAKPESSTRVVIYFDLQPTMDWPNIDFLKSLHLKYKQTPSKLELAMRVCLDLAYIHLRRGDRVECLSKNKQGQLVHLFNSKSSQSVLATYLDLVERSFAVDLEEAEIYRASRFKCHFGYGIGDFIRKFEFPEKVIPTKIRKIQILSSLETTTDYLSPKGIYFDQETHKKFYLGKKLAKNNELRNQVKMWQEKIEAQAREEGIDYISLNDLSPIVNYRQFVLGAL